MIVHYTVGTRGFFLSLIYLVSVSQKLSILQVSQRTHKCQAHPPGTVVRQTGELVEKLKKKHNDQKYDETKKNHQETHFPEISEANAELVRTGAKLSLEDMETESFRILADSFNSETESIIASSFSPEVAENGYSHKPDKIFETNIEELISSNAVDDKNLPSPSDILRNLCLSREDDFAVDQAAELGHYL